MKAFKSTLQALRTLRERQEQSALQEYGKALRAQEQARNQLDAVQQELLEAWLDFNQHLDAGSSAATLARVQAYCQAVERRRRDCERALKVARDKALQAFTNLLMMRQARAVVDRLCEAQKRRYQRQRRRKEQKALDDLASRRNTFFTLLQLTREPYWN